MMAAAGLQSFMLMTYHKVTAAPSHFSPIPPHRMPVVFGPPPHLPLLHTYFLQASEPHVVEVGQAMCPRATLQQVKCGCHFVPTQMVGDKMMATGQTALFCCCRQHLQHNAELKAAK